MTAPAASRTSSSSLAPRPLAGRLRRSQRRAGLVFILPFVALELLLLVLPMLQTLYYSFTSWDGLSSTWIGLDNYQRLFGDSTFWRVVLNNVFLLLSIPVAILMLLLVALLLYAYVGGGR